MVKFIITVTLIDEDINKDSSHLKNLNILKDFCEQELEHQSKVLTIKVYDENDKLIKEVNFES